MADKLVNMKIDPKAREAKYAEQTVAADVPTYPYGLNINLEEEALEKLGLEKLPKVDTEMVLYAKVVVTSASSNEHTAGGDGKTHKHRSVGLQITDLCLEAGGSKRKDADVLFSKE